MSSQSHTGTPLPLSPLADIPLLVAAYYSRQPDSGVPSHRVAFGTSGHRGSSLHHSFNEAHICAITQAVCDYRQMHGIHGPLFMGRDTHALSLPAHITALEVLAANEVTVCIDAGNGYVPTPVISHAILTYNAAHTAKADGIVITPSHNPPEDGGFKYNPPHGGPAGTAVTAWIEQRANELLAAGNTDVRRIPAERAQRSTTTHSYDYIRPYVDDLANMLDMQAIRDAKLRIGADPMGGAGLAYWEPIAETYKLTLTVVNTEVDPTFRFMPRDKDGKIRMDCSSPWAMAHLITLRDQFDIAFGNDPDTDRHGIVTRAGLMNPNHYLSTAVHYLFTHRPDWNSAAGVGKTLVSSSMLDRVAKALNRNVCEVPVGFKWFVPGLLNGDIAFGGEESAGASFARRSGGVWSTDKDGIIMNLLACEILAVTGKTPQEQYDALTKQHGSPLYERLEAPANAQQKAVLKRLSPDAVTAKELAGYPITARLTRAPGNDEPIGGLKVVTDAGWFAARPSGTEDVYKIYTESFVDHDHLSRIQEEAKHIVATVFAAAASDTLPAPEAPRS